MNLTAILKQSEKYSKNTEVSKYACVALFTIFTAIANDDDDKLFLQNG